MSEQLKMNKEQPFMLRLSRLYTWYWPTNVSSSQLAEYKLLNRMKIFKNVFTSEDNPLKHLDVKCETVKLDEENYINTLNINNTKDCDLDKESVLVMTHGFGVGLGIYYKNYEKIITDLPGWKLYSIDWLGMGRSSRAKFNLHPLKGQSKKEHILQAENFFIESLEEWRKKQNIERMVLLGHSLGGYLSACYALKYPQHVRKLILASPVGVPENPNKGGDNDQIQAIKDQKELDQPILAAESKSEMNVPRKIPAWVTYLWDNNYTPQSIIRFTGPYEQEEQNDLKEYIYHISSMKGSGEYALGTILSPGAYARNPLVNRLDGEVDWMDKKHAEKILPLMKNAKIEVIPKAGHQLFIENPEHFNKLVAEEVLNSPA